MLFSTTLPNGSNASTHAQLAAWLTAIRAAAVQEQYANPCRPVCAGLTSAEVVNPVPPAWLPLDRRDPRLHVLGLYAQRPGPTLPHGQPLLVVAFQPGGACICTAASPTLPEAPGSSAPAPTGPASGPNPVDTVDTADPAAPASLDIAPADPDAAPVDPAAAPAAQDRPAKALGPCCGRCCLLQLWRCADFPLTQGELQRDLQRTFGQPITPGDEFPPIGVVEHPGAHPGPGPHTGPLPLAAGPAPDPSDDGAMLPENSWLRTQIEPLDNPDDNGHLFPGWCKLRIARVGYMDLQYPRRSFDLAADRIVKNLKRKRGG